MIFLATSFRWQMQARTIQAELPALACVSIAIALASLRRHRELASAAAGVAFALGVLFKLLALPFAPGLLWLVIADRAVATPNHASARTGSREARALFFLGAAALTLVAIGLGYDLSAFQQQAIQFHLLARASAPPPWPLLQLALAEDPGFWLATLLAIPLLAMAGQRELLRDVLLLALPALAFILSNRPFFPHHLIPLVPLLALLGAALAIAVEWIAQRKRFGALAAAGLIALVACLRIPVLQRSARALEMARLSDEDLRAVARLDELLSPGEQLVTDDQFLAFLAERLPPPALCDTSSVRMKAMLDDAVLIEGSRTARAVMFWTNRLNTSPAFVRWTEQRFPLREELGPDHRILWRAEAR